MDGSSASSSAADLRFDSLSDAQVGAAFDFLPLVQHALRQMAHASADANTQTDDAAALQAATSALVNKLTQARDLLQLLPNVDVSQAEQEAESRSLDVIIARKKKLIETFQIRQRAAAATAATAASSAAVKDEVAIESGAAASRT